VPRLALLTGSPGAVADAIAAELGLAGYAIRQLPVGPGGAIATGGAAGLDVRGAELVVHLGVRTPRDLDEAARAEVESQAALGAAALAREAGARRLVHVSTASVYGRPRNLPCREGELKSPRTVYERIRWRAEQASWAAFRKGAPLTVLRPTILYGPTLRGGPVRALALVTLLNRGRRRVPIIRRGPVAHLVHLDEAPLPLAEHLAAALAALGYEPGRILPTWPRLTGGLLWLVRHVPDRTLLAAVNGRLARRWRRFAPNGAAGAALLPRIDREALHWMSADHYYDTSRLHALGWRPRHPISTESVPETIRALVANQLLPGTGGRALPAW
jgi:2-alkyl-3-oxoalkanoate reductase